ncbi:hypothetical protein ACO22_00191 [Paracoccidioides brasiliensis]|uniref:Autophagy-related protein 16 domain-containing protein n=1 Tax=Paracoccidioides brasiliensis TaxID=121759 RepID=A0A1D2JQ54_PARBR|nr:hypothetical protein ACO22_00191 [Paracoccidioides brasiliensis]
MVPPVAGNAFYAFANFRARPLAKVRTDLEAECGCAAAIRNLLEGENSAHASAVAVLRETHNEALISHSSSIEALEGISKPSDGTPTRLQQESAECQKLLAQVQRQLATSTALTDANAKVIEHQAHIDHLKQRINQLVQTLTDALTGQQLERLRTRVQTRAKRNRNHIKDKIRSSQRIKGLEEDPRKAAIAPQ